MKFKTKIGDKNLKVELRNLAERANASVWIQYGETVILATCVMGEEKPELGFFPLTVNFLEKYYAAGEIYGSRYFKREGKPSTEAVITSRLIDRAIRPLFPDHFKREVQVIVTCFSWDGKNDPDVPGLLGASLALSLSDIPWDGPLGAVRVGRQKKRFIINPNYEQREQGQLDFVVSGVEQDSQILINMIETQAQQLKESEILKATEQAQSHLSQLINFQKEIVQKVETPSKVKCPEPNPQLQTEVKEFIGQELQSRLYGPQAKGMEKVNELKQNLNQEMEEREPQEQSLALDLFEKELGKIIHDKIIEEEKRPDRRKLNEIRELVPQVSILPRTHGSGLFSRGKTKVLSTLTLGGPEDQQLLEGMEIVGKKRFMHHYNFPPYSAGEVKFLRAPGRREIGHGVLVESTLLPLLPNFDDFPYAIRIVSEVLCSNGSTSMASVSSSSLALMDAGVPIERPAAGIAMGLMKNKNSYKILTDIQGPEDHHGDMDLKVAGTRKGIITIQMDVKIPGISRDILEQALTEAKQARNLILDRMNEIIKEPRPELSGYAPTVISLKIDPEKIGKVIGSGGSTINKICDQTGAGIDIEESGLIYISAEKESSAKKAATKIKNITKEIKVGEVYQGKVKKILDFGAFVEITPGKEGLVHISELAPRHVKKVENVVEVGDVVPVKVLSIKDDKISLSIKAAKAKV